MKQSAFRLIVLILLTTCLTPPAFCGDHGWYAGAAVGQSKARMDNIEAQLSSDVAEALNDGTASYEVDDTDTGWKVYTGYAVNNYFALELGYLDLGEVKIGFSSDATNLFGTTSKNRLDTLSSKIFSLSAVGRIPTQGNLAFLVKAGVTRWHLKEDDVRTCQTNNPTKDLCGSFLGGAGKASLYGNSVLYGLGAQYRMTDNLALRVEWENYLKIGDSDKAEQFDYNFFSAELEYYFPGVPQLDGQGFYLKTERLFYGAGVGMNKVSTTDPGVGVQVFIGYDPGYQIKKLKLDFEVGFMTTGDMKFKHPVGNRIATRANGIWGTATAHLPLLSSFELLARFGGEMGDDAGPLAGVGLGLITGKQIEFRLEYVIRENIDSAQLNIVYRPWSDIGDW